jgi:hypothetical protein
MNSIEQMFAHLVSDHHIKEKAKLENELKTSWKVTRAEQRIPSLLGSWVMRIEE